MTQIICTVFLVFPTRLGIRESVPREKTCETNEEVAVLMSIDLHILFQAVVRVPTGIETMRMQCVLYT